ncbi:hypothetical protein [Oligoflexus tunisiensis]|uniref:hypothetical protein n=1 Tax=Oligoflexus tunisiensis TaxID=708132 RepID=UPI00114CA41B|nr:hypothetical protein [Oligoflexus tunisiensis]
MKHVSRSAWAGQSGATLLEVCIASAILAAVIAAVTVQVQSVKKSFQATSRLMALDAFEASLGNFLSDKHIIEHSIQMAGSSALKGCILNATHCSPSMAQTMALYREGQKEPFTGRSVFYDYNGQLCKGRCPGYFVETRVTPRCISAGTCTGPDYVLVEANIHETGSKKPIRKIAQEVERFRDGLFPGLQLQCPGGNSVLRGIGIRGEPLCVPRSDIVFLDGNKATLPQTLQVAPLDCQGLNQKISDQFFISGLNAAGQLSCSPRFW